MSVFTNNYAVSVTSRCKTQIRPALEPIEQHGPVRVIYAAGKRVDRIITVDEINARKQKNGFNNQ